MAFFFPSIFKDWSPNSVDRGQGLETSRNILSPAPAWDSWYVSHLDAEALDFCRVQLSAFWGWGDGLLQMSKYRPCLSEFSGIWAETSCTAQLFEWDDMGIQEVTRSLPSFLLQNTVLLLLQGNWPEDVVNFSITYLLTILPTSYLSNGNG